MQSPTQMHKRFTHTQKRPAPYSSDQPTHKRTNKHIREVSIHVKETYIHIKETNT